jgi:hypothetical protein
MGVIGIEFVGPIECLHKMVIKSNIAIHWIKRPSTVTRGSLAGCFNRDGLLVYTIRLNDNDLVYKIAIKYISATDFICALWAPGHTKPNTRCN